MASPNLQQDYERMIKHGLHGMLLLSARPKDLDTNGRVRSQLYLEQFGNFMKEKPRYDGLVTLVLGTLDVDDLGREEFAQVSRDIRSIYVLPTDAAAYPLLLLYNSGIRAVLQMGMLTRLQFDPNDKNALAAFTRDVSDVLYYVPRRCFGLKASAPPEGPRND